MNHLFIDIKICSLIISPFLLLLEIGKNMPKNPQEQFEFKGAGVLNIYILASPTEL